MARTRIYTDGRLARDNAPLSEARQRLGDPTALVWIDLGPSDLTDLDPLVEQLGLHPVSVHEALDAHPRAGFLHHDDHDFVSLRALRFDDASGHAVASPVAIFLTANAMLTLRTDDNFPLDSVLGIWDLHEDLCECGVGFLLHGVLKEVLQSQYDTAIALDEALDRLEEAMFSDRPDIVYLQRRSHRLGRSVVEVRRIALSTPDTLDELYEAVPRLITPQLEPYFTGVRRHADRVSERSDSLRELVDSIQQTRMALADNRMNIVTKRVSGWAALIAVPAVITGFYGVNLPFPGYGKEWGLITCSALIVIVFAALYVLFKRKDWL